jgi:hypothetical protein
MSGSDHAYFSWRVIVAPSRTAYNSAEHALCFEHVLHAEPRALRLNVLGEIENFMDFVGRFEVRISAPKGDGLKTQKEPE